MLLLLNENLRYTMCIPQRYNMCNSSHKHFLEHCVGWSDIMLGADKYILPSGASYVRVTKCDAKPH